MSVHNEEKRIVEQLSAAMMAELSVNRHKPGWLGDNLPDLFLRVEDELTELQLAIETGNHRDVLTECADAANFLAMIADVALSNARRGKTGGG